LKAHELCGNDLPSITGNSDARRHVPGSVRIVMHTDANVIVPSLSSLSRDRQDRSSVGSYIDLSQHLPSSRCDGRRDLLDGIVGISRRLREVLDQVLLVAPTDATVLIEGETGTGKELFAKAVHARSSRCDRPFIPLNCAAIPAELVESELFGHEKGAFTGALTQRIGRFETADGGTLFLDEIGEMPLALQSKLLRILQEQEFERLGSTSTRRVNVRIVAATNQDLAVLVAKNQFRADLYYRLSVFPIALPPLRRRPEDIPLLVAAFVYQHAGRMSRQISRISEKAMDDLIRYPWPGNVRELQNVIERAVILTQGDTLMLPPMRSNSPLGIEPITLHEAEHDHILRALDESDWVVGGKAGAAARLGLKRTTLIDKMRRLGLSRDMARGNLVCNETL
jgi:formate hydrogenlyase transcriptional activator